MGWRRLAWLEHVWTLLAWRLKVYLFLPDAVNYFCFWPSAKNYFVIARFAMHVPACGAHEAVVCAVEKKGHLLKLIKTPLKPITTLLIKTLINYY